MTNPNTQLPKELENQLQRLVKRTRFTVPRSALFHEGTVSLMVIPHALEGNPGFFDVAVKVAPDDREQTSVLEGTRIRLSQADQSGAMLPQPLDRWGQTTFHRLEAGEYHLTVPALVCAEVLSWFSALLTPLREATLETVFAASRVLAKSGKAESAGESNPNIESIVGPFTFTTFVGSSEEYPVMVITNRPEWHFNLLQLKVGSDEKMTGMLVPFQWSEAHGQCRADFFINSTEKMNYPESYEPIPADTFADGDAAAFEKVFEFSIERAGRYTRRTWRKIADLEGMPDWVKHTILQSLDKVE